MFSLLTEAHGKEGDIEAYSSITEVHLTLQYKACPPPCLSSSLLVSSAFLDTIGLVSFHPLNTCMFSISVSRHWDQEKGIELDVLEEGGEEELENVHQSFFRQDLGV